MSTEKRKIWRVESDGSLTKILVETSAEQVVVTPKEGVISATNVQAAIEEIAGIAATGGVTSVNGMQGAVVLEKADVGLDKVDNTADADKNVNSAVKDGSQRVIVDTYATKTELQSGLAGKSLTKTYDDYIEFVTSIMAMDDKALKSGDNVLIKKLEVPDMWVYKVNTTKTNYTYSSDANIIAALATETGLTIGYYTFAKLETQKVDLTDYQTKTDNSLTTTAKTVVGAINELDSELGTLSNSVEDIVDGTTTVPNATSAETATKLSANRTIAVTGDVSGSTSTDLSGNVSITTTIADGSVSSTKLTNSGITPGTYSALTVDAKGRATIGHQFIEWGTSGQTTPSDFLVAGGIFFELQ